VLANRILSKPLPAAVTNLQLRAGHLQIYFPASFLIFPLKFYFSSGRFGFRDGNLDFQLEKFFSSGFFKFPADFSVFPLENLFSS